MKFSHMYTYTFHLHYSLHYMKFELTYYLLGTVQNKLIIKNFNEEIYFIFKMFNNFNFSKFDF